jgi:serine O-acetyltransferase
MILSKADYKNYLIQDQKALGRFRKKKSISDWLFPDEIESFQRLLRRVEYVQNVKSKSGWGKLKLLVLKYRFRKKSLKLGFTIPANVFGPGLAIVHYGTIVVNADARVGSNCRLHACTNIGASGGKRGAPKIGDNVYIGPGAKVYGDITIASNTAIAANAAVNKSLLNEGKLIGGVPAKVIGDINIKQIIKHI